MSRTYISRTECFEVLGIQDGASEDEIRRAYKKLALKHHPDKNNNSEESTTKFKEISTAYQKLTKPDLEGEDDFDFVDMNEMFMHVMMSRIFGMNPFMRGGGGPVFINPGGFGGFHFHDFDDEDDYYDEDEDEDDEEHDYHHDHPFFHYQPHSHYHHDNDEEDDEFDEDDEDEEIMNEAAKRYWRSRMGGYYDEGDYDDDDDDEAEEDLDADDDDTIDPSKIGDERYKHTFKYNQHPAAAAIRDSEYGVFTDLLDDHPEYAAANLGAGNTAMHFCARFGRVRFANYLCDRGGLHTIAVRNDKEESPIEIAEAYATKSVNAFREIAARARKQAKKEEQDSKAKQQQPKKKNKKNKYKNTQKNSNVKKQETGVQQPSNSNRTEDKEESESEEDEGVSFGDNVFSVLQGKK